MDLSTSGPILIVAVALVGVLHTMVPDHWAPIALLARQHGWTKIQTARVAAVAGAGHTVSTLVIACVVWVAGIAFAARFGHLIGAVSSLALIVFGAWIAISSFREIRKNDLHGHSYLGHSHVHRHANGLEHRHWHEHDQKDWHATDGNLAPASAHEHAHATSGRTALLLILGSSPMVEGIPAFFAAGRYGVVQLGLMAAVFAAATITTYVLLCVASASGIERLNMGKFEGYGEVLSGSFIALLGVVFAIVPAL